jgi:hypothetical protein
MKRSQNGSKDFGQDQVRRVSTVRVDVFQVRPNTAMAPSELVNDCLKDCKMRANMCFMYSGGAASHLVRIFNDYKMIGESN